MSDMEKEARIQLVMERVKLTRDQAVEYLMEREYNQMNHHQALAALMDKPWLWSDYKPNEEVLEQIKNEVSDLLKVLEQRVDLLDSDVPMSHTELVNYLLGRLVRKYEGSYQHNGSDGWQYKLTDNYKEENQ